MNSVDKKTLGFRIQFLLRTWLIVFLLIIIGFVTTWIRGGYPMQMLSKPSNWLAPFLFGVVGASLSVGLLIFVRWLFCWRNLRRTLVGMAIFATLIAIFYAEEDWRGKRAWENCKRDLEAQGYVMDWEKLIPPPVPDDQNFFKASLNIEQRFIRVVNFDDAKRATLEKHVPVLDFSPSFPVLDTAKTGPIMVVNLTVIPSRSSNPEFGRNAHWLKLNDASSQREAGKIIRDTLGEMAIGSQGFNFSAFSLDKITPAQIIVQADTPSIGDLENLVSVDTITNMGRLRIEAIDGRSGSFRVLLTGVKITAATDYLKWSDQFEPFLDETREALKRPYAQIDGDYSQPYSIPIPNFITMRALAQMLSQRTQCYLLLGRPEQALGELTLLSDSRRILMQAPTGKPLTLVGAMINVAITGLYVDTIAYGLRSHLWSGSQLTTLQGQLKSVDLPPLMVECLKEDLVYISRTGETSRASKIVFMPSIPANGISTWQKVKNLRYRLVDLAPRGWVYQNILVAVNLARKPLDGFDADNNLILPTKTAQAMREIDATLGRWSPWNIWASLAIPNFTKATLTTAKNQTFVNEAQVACALERYHLAHGDYPETLDALLPQFMDQLPHDLIGGQSLHYRRTDDGKFLLYSVGWNEKDDGGVVDTKIHAEHDSREYGDWVWE